MKIKKIQFISILVGIFGLSIFLGYITNNRPLGEYRINPFTGQLDLVGDTSTSTGSGVTTTLTANQVAFGSPDNTVTSSPNFTFNSSTNQLAVTNVTSTNVTTTILYASSAVGIGTTPDASSYALDIEMGSRDVRFKGSSIFGNGFFTENSTSNQQWALGTAGTSGILGPQGAFYFYDNTSSFLSSVLTKAGLLGLGVTSPGSRVSLAASTTATGGIAFGTDTNLYRSAANVLTTDDSLIISGNATSTNFNSTGLSFTNGNGTSVTTTNLALSGFSNGSILFTTSSGNVTQDNAGLFWDDVNNRLGVNTSTVGSTLVVAGNAELRGTLQLYRDGTSSAGWNNNVVSTYIFGGFRPMLAFNGTTGKIGYLASGGTQGHELITQGRSVLINTRNEAGTGEFNTAGGSITSYTNAALDIVGTWNNSTTRYWAIRSNFTDTGSNATTSLIDLMVGSVTKFNVQKDGWVSISTSTPIAALTLNASTTATGGLAFGTDVNLYRSAADSLTTDDHFYAASTTITGGFFQTDLGDCNADTEAIMYNNTTGKFECGDDDSGGGSLTVDPTEVVFGAADGTATSTVALRYVTSTATLYAQNFFSPNATVALGNATGDYITLSGGFITFTSSSIQGYLTVSGATSLQGLTFTTASGTSVTSTNLFATNGNFTRATSTNFFATNAIFTNVTSTNLRVSGITSLAGLSFTSATGTGSLQVATSTITGGLFQTGLATCNADNETLGYNATTGKFECGDDDTTSPVVSTTNANTRSFTDLSPASMVDNNTTEIFNDTTRPNIQPQSVNNSVLVTLDFQVVGGGANDTDVAVRVVRENDPGSTTPTCDLTSDAQVGSSIVGGSLATAFLTNSTDIQTARLSVVDSPATTTPVYYTICSSASSTLGSAPGSRALHVSLTEIQGSGGGTSREFTRIVTSTGSGTWTKPVTSTGFAGIRLWCVGGGGGGGGSGSAGEIGGGGGGGGGAWRILTSADLIATSSVSFTVGVAGTAGAAGNNNGGAGGTTSFGSFVTCTGGSGGNAGNGVESQTTAGVGSGGNVNGSGRRGREPGPYTDSYRGYGGGACADQGDTTENQDSVTNTLSPGGVLGQWCGAGGQRPGSWDANSRNGGNAASFGGGGSGGQKVGAGADASGGEGRQGVLVIQEYYQ